MGQDPIAARLQVGLRRRYSTFPLNLINTESKAEKETEPQTRRMTSTIQPSPERPHQRAAEFVTSVPHPCAGAAPSLIQTLSWLRSTVVHRVYKFLREAGGGGATIIHHY